jgi:hypothetical protein
VDRRDLNNSPGWSTANWRWLLASYKFGQVDKIAWPERSKTKQLVAQQPHDEDDGGLFLLSALPGITPTESLPEAKRELRRTLVLAHAMDPVTNEFELFLGRTRWNADGGHAWAWRVDLTTWPRGRGQGGVPHQPVDPFLPDGGRVEDAKVRVRRPTRGQDRPRAIGDT